MGELNSERNSQDQSNSQLDVADKHELRSWRQGFKYYISSRQHVMLCIVVLFLLLLIISISSKFKTPIDDKKKYTFIANNKRDINISKMTSLSKESLLSQEQNQSKNIIMPSIDTEAKGLLPFANQKQGKHIEYSSNIVNVLRQGQTFPVGKQQLVKNTTSIISSKIPPSAKKHKIIETIKTNARIKHIVPVDRNYYRGDLLSSPARNYTLQLSGARRSESLESFAKKNNLMNYKIYQTVRNGQSWYVLIHNNYRSIREAKNAISTLPISVQKEKPWVRKFEQVKRDHK